MTTMAPRTQTTRGGFLVAAAAAFVLVTAIGAAGWSAANRRGSAHPVRSVPTRQALSPPSSPAALPLPQGAPLLPQVNLGSLSWANYYGVELPTSPTAGPRIRHGGQASGFAHTPLGALLAAVNIAVRGNPQWGPAIFGPTIRAQVTGPDTPALLAACQEAYDEERPAAGVPPGQPLGRAYVTQEAFRWEIYTPQDATLDIVSAGPGNAGVTVRAATRIEVWWRGGDWRVVAPPGGDWGNSATQITSLQGYTTFPAPPA